jgi:nitric oxide reductase subunit C
MVNTTINHNGEYWKGIFLKLRTFLLLSFLSFSLFVGVTLISARLPSPIPEQAAAGKLVWQRHNCVSCHTLFGNGGYVGEDLTNIIVKETSSYLVNYLVDPPVMRPNRYHHHPALDENDAEDLVRYLEFVHTIPTLGWPPRQEKAGKEL